jgi:hypothetical protein
LKKEDSCVLDFWSFRMRVMKPSRVALVTLLEFAIPRPFTTTFNSYGEEERVGRDGTLSRQECHKQVGVDR